MCKLIQELNNNNPKGELKDVNEILEKGIMGFIHNKIMKYTSPNNSMF